jgi:hypothetical protein
MAQYISVRASSWDLDGLITQINAKAGEGYRVVSVVNTGSDLAAILEPAGGADGTATALVADRAPAAAEPTAFEPATFEPSTWAVADVAEPTPVAAPEPSPWGTTAVEEPAGWGVASTTAPEPTPTTSSPWGDTSGASTSTSTSTSTSGAYGAYGAAEPTPAAAPVSTPVTPEPAPVVTTPAGWYPDPSGRFELRYWDGVAWTEHVSRGGQQSTDPPVA